MPADRHCPLCHIPLQPRESQGVEVDICPTCTGIWLDRGEFDAVVATRVAGRAWEEILSETAKDPDYCRFCDITVHADKCPECDRTLAMECPVDGSPMHVVVFDALELDRCGSCRGIWLDGNERRSLGKRPRRDVPNASAGSPASTTAQPAATSQSMPPKQSTPPRRGDNDNAEGAGVGARAARRSAPMPAVQRRYATVHCQACGASVPRRSCTETGGTLRCASCHDAMIHKEAQERAAAQMTSPRAALDEHVTCVGCGHTVALVVCVRRMGELYCESCVLDGRLPTGNTYLVSNALQRGRAAPSVSSAGPVRDVEGLMQDSDEEELALWEHKLQGDGNGARADDNGDETVLCAGCDALVPRSRAARHLEEFYCEACVIGKRHPKARHDSVSHMIATATFAEAQARGDLERRKHRNAEMKRFNTKRIGYFGYRRMEMEMTAAAVTGAVNFVRSLFLLGGRRR